MCYTRGQASDYDRWAKLTGSEKFSYKNVLPYFKKSQKAHGYGDPEYNGTDGEINVEKNHMDKLLYGDLCEAGIQGLSSDRRKLWSNPLFDDCDSRSRLLLKLVEKLVIQ